MQGEPCTATTYCPRCRRPIVWARRVSPPRPLAVINWTCYCNLTDREWATLAAAAALAMETSAREQGGGSPTPTTAAPSATAGGA